MKPYEYYYRRFLQGFSNTKDIDYRDKKSVRKNNQGVDMYRNAAASIGKYYPEKIPEFAIMLEDDDQDLRIVCAVSILELMEADQSLSEKALNIIRDLAVNGSSFERNVWSVWIKRYMEKKENML